MRRVAGVVLEAFQERRNVSAGAEGEVFASHLAEAGRVAEVACDTCDGAGDIDLGGNLILGYAHDGLLSYWLDEFQSAAAPQRHRRALCSLEHLNQSTSWTRLAAPNVRDDRSQLAFGMTPALEAESAGGMTKVPKAW
jgi:hypothetical protein